jgi:hypothetical protein
MTLLLKVQKCRTLFLGVICPSLKTIFFTYFEVFYRPVVKLPKDLIVFEEKFMAIIEFIYGRSSPFCSRIIEFEKFL